MNIFSEREQMIIKIIGRRTVNYATISSELFTKFDKPFDDLIAISNSVNRIIRKCKRLKLDWKFEKLKKDNRIFIRKIKVV